MKNLLKPLYFIDISNLATSMLLFFKKHGTDLYSGRGTVAQEPLYDANGVLISVSKTAPIGMIYEKDRLGVGMDLWVPVPTDIDFGWIWSRGKM